MSEKKKHIFKLGIINPKGSMDVTRLEDIKPELRCLNPLFTKSGLTVPIYRRINVNIVHL